MNVEYSDGETYNVMKEAQDSIRNYLIKRKLGQR